MGCNEFLPANEVSGDLLVEYLAKVAGGESVRIADTSAHTGLNAYAMYIEADTVFSVIKAGGTDVKASKGLTGTVVTGGLHTFNDVAISDLTLTSGSVILYSL